MKIMLIADGRSPITLRWIESMREVAIEVCLVSTYPCARPESVSGFYLMPVAFSNTAKKLKQMTGSKPAEKAEKKPAAPAAPASGKASVSRFRTPLMSIRYWLGPLTLPYYGMKLRRIIHKVKPDAVHALRIPFEGMLGKWMPKGLPFAVSIWGNDLTLHAKGSPLMNWETRQTLRRANALAADAARDIRLGREWGFDPEGKTLVIPGSGGISFTDINLIADEGIPQLNWLPADYHIILNPRGFRPGSVRNDTFFQSIPQILSTYPNTLFLCCSMAGQPEAEEWVRKLQVEKNVVLLPTLRQADLWPLFRRAEATLSISQHDGTPNSLLEAMALGCFPIAGEIESVREWITPGVNGILIDPSSPTQLATAVMNVIENPEIRIRAAEINRSLIQTRAEKSVISASLAAFYQTLTGQK